jgi:diguanylate cyclase (GGDEF)-like protein/PAS domain S-box-containing protein
MARVLIVEDEGIVALDLRRRLEDMGHVVAATVATGEDAVRDEAVMTPDLVLMDIRLSGALSGTAAARRIRERSSVPLIYLTAYAGDKSFDEVRETRPFAYLTKPIRSHELHAAVELALIHHGASGSLRLKGERLESVIHLVQDPVAVIDDGERVQLLNAAAAQLVGLGVAEAIGRSFAEVFGPERPDGDPLDIVAVMRTAAPRRAWPARVVARRDVPADVEMVVATLDTPESGALRVITIRDVTTQHARESRLRHSALHDPLTGLPNRLLFEEHLEHSHLQLSRRPDYVFAVAFVDLDGFKSVNDNYGHDEGDRVIRETAHRLKKLLRPSDVIARLGGDEFVVLVENLRTRDDLARVAGRVVDSIALPHTSGSASAIRLSASVGLATSAEGYSDPGAMLKAADAAMYAVKMRGKSGFAFAAPG